MCRKKKKRQQYTHKSGEGEHTAWVLKYSGEGSGNVLLHLQGDVNVF